MSLVRQDLHADCLTCICVIKFAFLISETTKYNDELIKGHIGGTMVKTRKFKYGHFDICVPAFHIQLRWSLKLIPQKKTILRANTQEQMQQRAAGQQGE